MYVLYVICKIKENVTENGLVKKKFVGSARP